MDILRKVLLVAFYVGIVAVGIIGFIALKSVRDKTPPAAPPAREVQNPLADSLVSEEVVK
jgi:hypothetical protein